MRASDNAGRDRLAVQPFAVTGDRFDRVRESVAEIQKRASVRLFFARIGGDDCQFVGDRAGDGEAQKRRRRGRRFDFVGALLDAREKIGVAEQAVFDDFGQARSIFPRGQSRQRRQIAHDRARRMKRADQVFAARMIDAGFASDRGIGLGQQCRRNLRHGDSAQASRGGESGRIANRPAAQSENDSGASQARFDKRIDDGAPRFDCFRGFSGGRENNRRGRDGGGFERAQKRLAVQIENIAARDQRRFAGGDFAPRRVRNRSLADENAPAASGRRQFRRHDKSAAASDFCTRRATSSGGASAHTAIFAVRS